LRIYLTLFGLPSYTVPDVSGSAGTISETRGSRTTAFERNLLPGFASWTVEQIERWKPDYIVPAETKGARVLDAALNFARKDLGARISAPVIYSSALAYEPEERLRGARVLVVDDAVRTGSSLRRHREQIARYGVDEIESIACIGCADDASGWMDEVFCYLQAGSKLYERYVWQLTELVVARGLPPEVDHFLLELQLGRHLALGWSELIELLSGYGTITVDGPERRHDKLAPATLHFPQLPGTRMTGREPDDGPHKLRFFPDPDAGRVLVVPISFPSLTLAGIKRDETLSRAQARAAMESELGTIPEVGNLLIDAASTLDPRTLFRALSAVHEIELSTGLARLLASEMPAASVRVEADIFERLYGAATGSLLGARVASAIETASRWSPLEASERKDVNREPTLYLDGSVDTATNGLARELKSLYESAASSPDHDPAKRVGLSMGELAALLEGKDPLLTSRCVDFGLTLLTLVPFIDVIESDDGGTLKIQRSYRVSENNRTTGSYVSLDTIRREKSGEALALICHRLRGRLPSLRDRSVPISLLTSVVAILRPLTLEEQEVTLKALPIAGDGLELVVLDTVDPVTIDGEVSAHFKVGDDGGVLPSEGFDMAYAAKDLTLDLDDCTERIETNLEMVIEVIDELGVEGPQLDEMLRAWALSTDQRLGLSHVRYSIDVALQAMRRPLNLIRAGGEHERSLGLTAIVDPALRGAREKLELLTSDWSTPVSDRIPASSGRSKERLKASLGAPSEAADPVYEFAGSLVALVGSLAALVEALDAVSARSWRGDTGEEDRKIVERALFWGARAKNVLTSLGEDEESLVAPDDWREAVVTAAVELLDVIELIGAFNAASAGNYCGPKGARLPSPHFQDARHAAILSLDLTDSTPHAELVNARENKRWVGEGLNIAAQWTRAFGGYEFSDRKGDELAVEFDDGDGAALSAAAILCHTAALRSVGLNDLHWDFHTGVECGEIDDDDGSNVIGSPINRAAKLAKEVDDELQKTFVPIADEGARHCSQSLRSEDLSETGPEVTIGGRLIHPRLLDSAKALEQIETQVRETAKDMAAEILALSPSEQHLRTESEPESGDLATGAQEAASG
jgi:hypothetical protein